MNLTKIMAAPSSAAAVSGAKRRKLDEKRTYVSGEIPAPVLSLLSGSLVLHTGVQPAVHDTLADAIANLPFTLEEAVHLLGPVAESGNSPFPLPGVATLLAPFYAPLRSLTVHEAVKAWVLVDFLCLPAPARRLEEDLVQRYTENSGAEADWKKSFTVDGCPACDTLWELVTKQYTTLRGTWEDDAPLPTAFGVQPTAAQASRREAWQRGECTDLFRVMKALKDSSTAVTRTLFFAPSIDAVLNGCSDPEVVLAASDAAYHLSLVET